MALALLLSPSVPPQKTSPSLDIPLVSFTPHKAARMVHIPQGHSLDGLPQKEAVRLPALVLACAVPFLDKTPSSAAVETYCLVAVY